MMYRKALVATLFVCNTHKVFFTTKVDGFFFFPRVFFFFFSFFFPWVFFWVFF